MDERRHFTAVAERREASTVLPFAEQREQIRRYLGELSESTSAAEAEIVGVVKQLLDDLQSAQAAGGGGAALSQDLKDREAQLAEQLAQLGERRRELDDLSQSLDRRRAESDESSRRTQAQQRQLLDERRQFEHDRDELASLRARLDEKLRRHELQAEELEAERTRTKTQRRRLAAELSDQRDANRRELSRRAAELDDRRAELDRRAQDIDRRTSELERQAAELVDAASADDSLRQEVDRLREALSRRSAELDEAEARLSEADRRVSGSDDAGEAAEELADLRRRLADSQEDLRDLRIRNATLEKAQEASTTLGGGSQPMDWESQKRRLLAALDADFDPRNPADRADRLTIEGAIQITDNVVAAKEREIAELKRRLDHGVCELGDRPLDDARNEAGRDDWPAERRSQIEELEKSLKEELRAAEIENSIERAKLARERTLLDEQRAELDARKAQADKEGLPTSSTTVESKKPAGGRWLARLGLRDRDAG